MSMPSPVSLSLTALPIASVSPLQGSQTTHWQQQSVSHGQLYFHVDLVHAASKKAVLTAIGQSMHFPSHYGANFDALADCLSELDIGNASGIVLVLENLPALADFDLAAKEILLEILQDAAHEWAQKKIAFRVFYS
ncbi:barstar family protein [Undibacterium sp. CY7W]|uniref:Barstar family protein n=1 Tax=Undibacterium rugosum TaxID=2762291 RepID=A0A923IBX0_9BURK|nr:barstar family protein [Undibacterium rugosum]MBC3936495.1 barstar family protein [Undibacterium rugosum]